MDETDMDGMIVSFLFEFFLSCHICTVPTSSTAKTQSLYVPVYSSIFHGDSKREE
jgi:hypothetical protein